MTTFSQSPWSRCIASPSDPPRHDDDDDDEEEEEEEEDDDDEDDQDPKGRRSRAVTMSSKHALRPDGSSECESEPPASSVSNPNPGSMSE